MRQSFVEFVGGVDNLRALAELKTIDEAVLGTGFDRSCVRKLAQKYRIRFRRKCQKCKQSRAPDDFNKSSSVCFRCRVHINQRPAGHDALWRQETKGFDLSLAGLTKPFNQIAKGVRRAQ